MTRHRSMLMPIAVSTVAGFAITALALSLYASAIAAWV
jgi:hypothetical protein